MKRRFTIVTIALLSINIVSAQEGVPNMWHQLDKTETGYNGISLGKAYQLIQSKNLKSNRVIVAVLDTGIDTLHEDLKPVLWTNKKEIAGNSIDDDKNGFIDDIHGWNFLGGKDGRNVKDDSGEGSRVYYSLKPIWDGKTVERDQLSADEKNSYDLYLKAKAAVVGNVDEEELGYLKFIYPKLISGDSVLKKETGKQEYTGNDLKTFTANDLYAKMARGIIINICKINNNYDITNTQLIEEIGGKIRKAEAATTPPREFRKEIVGDNEMDINDRYYGNNDIMASFSMHGTHCSGIIAAARNNNKGIDGIAGNTEIMMLRVVPNGDEHDKDIANAIRYAVDNGAKIISMSFGKDFSPNKQWVDEAFRYADSKSVLLIQAAGNDAQNIDSTENYPSPYFIDGKGRAPNLITVGASGDEKNGGLIAYFSNYGKKTVDVFAPGVTIYSTIPGDNTYGNANGTSMAGPVVAGIAALLLEHYPQLTPQQVKYIIEKSVSTSTEKVKQPGTNEMVSLSELCRTGGFVNAYEAIKLAGTIKMPSKQALPKSKFKKGKLG